MRKLIVAVREVKGNGGKSLTELAVYEDIGAREGKSKIEERALMSLTEILRWMVGRLGLIGKVKSVVGLDDPNSDFANRIRKRFGEKE